LEAFLEGGLFVVDLDEVEEEGEEFVFLGLGEEVGVVAVED
jgi:hypothetical protein